MHFAIQFLILVIVTSVHALVGGLLANRNEFPTTVLLKEATQDQIRRIEVPRCTGLVFSNFRYVLTSTDCAINIANTIAYAGVHDSSLDEITMQKRNLTRTVELDSLQNPQLILYRLEKDFISTEYVGSAELQIFRSTNQPPNSAVLAGWGSTSLRNNEHPNRKLRKVEIPLLESDECSRQAEGLPSGSFFCGGNMRGGHGGCRVDVGSPLNCQGAFCGIMIKGSCGRPREYDIYANLPFYAAALEEAVSNDNQ